MLATIPTLADGTIDTNIDSWMTPVEQAMAFNIDMNDAIDPETGEPVMADDQVRDTNRWMWKTEPTDHIKVLAMDAADKAKRLDAHESRIHANLAKIAAGEDDDLDEPINLDDMARAMSKFDCDFE